MNIEVKLVDPRAEPLRAYPTDAGADLFSVAKHIVYPNEMCLVDTGVAVRIPEGFVGLVYSRSGQGKLRIHLANSVGVIDAAYRGTIKVMIINNGTEPYEINPYATKVAQLVVTPIVLCNFRGYEGHEDAWLATARGTNGLGSTG
jgi:dUTP pyrophosphatase